GELLTLGKSVIRHTQDREHGGHPKAPVEKLQRSRATRHYEQRQAPSILRLIDFRTKSNFQ
ncbi:MAG: hypothetical protein ACLPWF_15630, partial [Bryobacteraceae bacterium]